MDPALIIGHRGAAASAPENTVAGFCKAASLGVRWVEFDVRLTADNVVVVLHDDTVDRTTDGCGAAAAMSFAEIERLDAGGWFGAAFRGERVPSFEAVIALLGELGLGAVVELKPAKGREAATAEATMALLRSRWPRHLPPPIVSSFAEAALIAARAAAPGLQRALLVEAVPADWRARLAATGSTMLHADHQRLAPAEVAALRAAGTPVFAYTVNDRARAELLASWGVAGLFSDRPERLADLISVPRHHT
jgi:glycerophosphoryl diester phosphodiesterase